MIKDFKKNKIFEESGMVGDQLQLARENAGLTIKKVSKKTKINQKYLEALESGEYNKLPAGLYERKFLKEYAGFLDLNVDRLLEEFEKEKKVEEQEKKRPYFSNFRLKKINFIVFPKITKSLTIVLITAICFAYLGYYLNNLLSSPELNIVKPKNDVITQEDRISVIGETNSEVKVYINGEAVLTDPTGEFNKEIRLKQGVNNIRITAQKKYSQKNTINKQILAK